MAKLDLARDRRRPVDGHAPGVAGKQLAAYAAAGIVSDHECTRPEEALEKIELGMRIMVREGTCARNLDELFPAIDAGTWARMMWCTDDRHPHDILTEGHVDAIVRKAVSKGLDPITAIRMATLIPAEYFEILDAGAIAPGRKANLIVFSDLNEIRAEEVYHLGQLIAENGQLVSGVPRPESVAVKPSMNLDPAGLDFSIPAGSKRMRVIRAIADQVVTDCEIMDVREEAGLAVVDTDRDILKIAVVDRHTGKGGMGIGFVTGMGLKQGALASSVAHDSHNIIVLGANDADMKMAVDHVAAMGGGFAVASGGMLLADLPLADCGLDVRPAPCHRPGSNGSCDRRSHELGATLKDPFMTLGFLALPVIPDLKITDKGLVDVGRFEVVPLFV